MNARGWLWLERAQAALPLLGAAALAGVTWWLVQSASEDTGPASAAKVSSAPDYELQQARIVRVDAQGRLEAVLDGQRIRHYPATDQLHVDTLALSARDAQGQGLQATAHEGVADQRAEVVTLQGDVRAVATPAVTEPGQGLRSAPAHFRGEGLRIDTRARVISADTPVELTQDGSVIRGQSLHHDDATGVTRLGGRVTGRYEAPPR